MQQAGGLIRLHYHNNFNLLELFSEVNGVLYYNSLSLYKNLEISANAHNHLTKANDGLFVDGSFIDKFSEVSGVLYYNSLSLYKNLEISQTEHNHLTKNDDGLFVDGSFIDRFDYDDENDELLFDDIIVSREYVTQDVIDNVTDLWSPSPFTALNKLNVNYLIKTLINNEKQQLYKNDSYDTIIVTITNSYEQSLRIKIGSDIVFPEYQEPVQPEEPEPQEEVPEETNPGEGDPNEEEPQEENNEEPNEQDPEETPAETNDGTDQGNSGTNIYDTEGFDLSNNMSITYNVLPNQEIAITTDNNQDLRISVSFA